MSNSSSWWLRLRAIAVAVLAVILTVAIAVLALTDMPERFGWVAASDGQPADSSHDDHGHDDHAGHGHEGHGEETSIELTAQARTNLKLRVEPLSVGPFTKYIEVPAVIAQWPGRTHIAVTSPLTGVINAIYVSRGELIQSGAPLFSIRLTHQDLVNTQESFLALLGELDVEEREIERLTSIARSGAVAGKTLIARQYERDKRMAAIRASRQALLLHGLSEEQIVRIEQHRELVREVIVYAPMLHPDQSLHHDSLEPPHSGTSRDRDSRFASMAQPVPPHEHIDAEFLITELEVSRGESVETGHRLAQLSDYSQILIEGHAFQKDGEALRNAAASGLSLQAVLGSSSGRPEIIDGLKISYIGNEVGRESRALPFYVPLENQIERSEKQGAQKYVSWKYKPGQRLQLRVPVDTIADAIVVPDEAVAEEGAERYVFVENGDHFDRVSVSVIASDSIHVAIANDGQVWPGQSIAINRAHQLQMALKNKSGGGIDPHAGHTH